MKKLRLELNGNISSSKSTVCDALRETGRYGIVEEPVHIWEETGVLKYSYQDPKRWGYTMQSLTFPTRLAEMLKPQTESVVVCERGIDADKICFGDQMYKLGNFNEVEWKVYNAIYSTWKQIADNITSSDHIKKLVVYLRSTPEECLARIKKRNRDGESKITMKYLENLHEIHEQWLMDHGEGKPGVIVFQVKNYDSLVEYKKHVISTFDEIVKNNLK